MDDTFVVFSYESQCNVFLDKLNSLHPSLHFTFEKKSNCSLPFLDVLVEKLSSRFITSIYCKPTFTGQCIRWNSFSPQKRKIHLIMTLSHRTLSICFPERLQFELDKIKSILLAQSILRAYHQFVCGQKNQVLSCSTQIWTRKMPCRPTSSLGMFCFDEVQNASKFGHPTLLHYCGTTFLHYYPASFRHQKRCTTCLKEKQRNLPVLMPLRQSVCRSYISTFPG